VTELDNDADGTPTANYLGGVDDAVDVLFTALPDALQVWHRPVNKAGGSQHTVITALVANKWAYLTSRRQF